MNKQIVVIERYLCNCKCSIWQWSNALAETLDTLCEHKIGWWRTNLIESDNWICDASLTLRRGRARINALRDGQMNKTISEAGLFASLDDYNLHLHTRRLDWSSTTLLKVRRIQNIFLDKFRTRLIIAMHRILLISACQSKNATWFSNVRRRIGQRPKHNFEEEIVILTTVLTSIMSTALLFLIWILSHCESLSR